MTVKKVNDGHNKVEFEDWAFGPAFLKLEAIVHWILVRFLRNIYVNSRESFHKDVGSNPTK